MKRLTEQLGNGCVALKRGVSQENMQEALGVLADYEDTGLTPDEITTAHNAMHASLGLACKIKALQDENARLKKERDTAVEEINTALNESLKLQSHYAELLNMYDNGNRRQFSTINEWINRLRETKWRGVKEDINVT